MRITSYHTLGFLRKIWQDSSDEKIIDHKGIKTGKTNQIIEERTELSNKTYLVTEGSSIYSKLVDQQDRLMVN